MALGLDILVNAGGGGGGGGFTRIEESFIPLAGQTVFALSGAPAVPDDTDLYVNTVRYNYGDDFVVSGSQLTWLNNGFQLDPSDRVDVVWFA